MTTCAIGSSAVGDDLTAYVAIVAGACWPGESRGLGPPRPAPL